MSLGRCLLFLFALAGGALVLLWRTSHLRLHASELLRGEGRNRFLRTAHVPVHRGMITDRRGEPLAVSTPVHSVWADHRRISELARERLDMRSPELDTYMRAGTWKVLGDLDPARAGGSRVAPRGDSRR